MKLLVTKTRKTVAFILVAISATIIVILTVTTERTIPEGVAGPEASALLQKMEEATGIDDWNKLAAISFTFSRNGNSHFVDKGRGFIEVIFTKETQKTRVQYAKENMFCSAWVDEKEIPQEESAPYCERAYRAHINDYFWLNPIPHFRSTGAVSEKVKENELLVRFESGGVTPGDSYLFYLDSQGTPVGFRIWAQVLPLRGIRFSFDDWVTVAGKARVSRLHKSFYRNVSLQNIQGFREYPTIETGDRFASLLQMMKEYKSTAAKTP